MTKGLKIILIIVAFIIGGLILMLIKAGSGRGVNSPGVGGPVGLIITFALLAGIRAIWKYKPDADDKKPTDEIDIHKLDKN